MRIREEGPVVLADEGIRGSGEGGGGGVAETGVERDEVVVEEEQLEMVEASQEEFLEDYLASGVEAGCPRTPDSWEEPGGLVVAMSANIVVHGCELAETA